VKLLLLILSLHRRANEDDLVCSVNSSLKHKHIFVSGPPRAGTTLLQLVLSSHSMITVTPETIFIQRIFGKGYPHHKVLNHHEINSLIQLMRSDPKLNSWPGFSLDHFLKKLSSYQAITIDRFLDFLFQFYAEQSDGGMYYLGNKKGLYADGYGPYTKKIFPEAKFLYIVRDPRDVTRSILKNLSERSLVDAACFCMYRDRYIAKMLEMFPNDVLVVRYEELVSEPERISINICDFLSVPFDKRMLKFYEMNRNSSRLIHLTKDIHQNTVTPFNPDLIGQWKKTTCFTAKELQTIEAITHEYMKRYGYEPEATSFRVATVLIRLKVLFKFWYRHLRREMIRHRKNII